MNFRNVSALTAQVQRTVVKPPPTIPAICNFCTSTILSRKKMPNFEPKEPVNWPKFNEVVYPPRGIEELQRPAVN